MEEESQREENYDLLTHTHRHGRSGRDNGVSLKNMGVFSLIGNTGALYECLVKVPGGPTLAAKKERSRRRDIT
jgi:hypothetical protein